ncbi:ABC transporter permease [Sporichthya sp.]|uniref:branched-chain amino acid ABC transporter permease n=1 Tax=Sporichthya sp. TaxID=65475 RepID=UPI00178FA4C5|nr:ABC transporter permease [Sporichthya sp.]MBA3741471.1 ABC transporter permease [Sporichthya sp.]
MKDYIPYIIFGLTSGAIYGISAMGLVLTYKTAGVFNFAHGAVCAAAAYAFYDLRELQGLPWPVAAALAVLVFGALLGLILERMALVLANVSTAYKIVATVGLLVAIRSCIVLRYGAEALPFQPFLPQETAFRIEGVRVNYDNVIDLLLGIAAAVALFVFFRASRLGTAMRGVVDDAPLLDMTGQSPAAVRRSAWIIGSVFAAASGVLFASVQQQLDVNILTLLVVQAFGAAAVGLFRSLPLAFVGGLAVGLLQKLAGKEVASHAELQGIDTNMPFLVLLLVLLVARRQQLVEVGRHIKERAVPPSPFPAWVRTAGFAALTVFILLVPQIVGTKLAFWNVTATQVILFLSLGLLVRTSGQISLCHIGFAAIGAAGFGHMLQHDVPWGLAVLIGGAIVIPIGAIIALPAMRLPTLYLALATLGFNIMLAQYAFGKSYMFGFGRLDARRPDVWGMEDDKRYYYLLVTIAFLCLLLVLAVERSRLGRLLRAMSDSPTALTTSGMNVNVTRVMVFCISGFLAGISGALYASLFGSVNQDSFNYLDSLVVLAILAISGRRTITAALVAAFLYKGLPGYVDTIASALGDQDPVQVQTCLNILFGVLAIAAAALSQGQFQNWLSDRGTVWEERSSGPRELRYQTVVAARRAKRPRTETDRSDELVGAGSGGRHG